MRRNAVCRILKRNIKDNIILADPSTLERLKEGKETVNIITQEKTEFICFINFVKKIPLICDCINMGSSDEPIFLQNISDFQFYNYLMMLIDEKYIYNMPLKNIINILEGLDFLGAELYIHKIWNNRIKCYCATYYEKIFREFNALLLYDCKWIKYIKSKFAELFGIENIQYNPNDDINSDIPNYEEVLITFFQDNNFYNCSKIDIYQINTHINLHMSKIIGAVEFNKKIYKVFCENLKRIYMCNIKDEKDVITIYINTHEPITQAFIMKEQTYFIVFSTKYTINTYNPYTNTIKTKNIKKEDIIRRFKNFYILKNQKSIYGFNYAILTLPNLKIVQKYDYININLLHKLIFGYYYNNTLYFFSFSNNNINIIINNNIIHNININPFNTNICAFKSMICIYTNENAFIIDLNDIQLSIKHTIPIINIPCCKIIKNTFSLDNNNLIFICSDHSIRKINIHTRKVKIIRNIHLDYINLRHMSIMLKEKSILFWSYEHISTIDTSYYLKY